MDNPQHRKVGKNGVQRQAGQKAAAAAEHLLSTGKGPFTLEQRKEVGAIYGAGESSIARMLGIHARDPHVFTKVKNGDLSMAEASRTAGFTEYSNTRDFPSGSVYFGRGDKFWQAVSPLSRYLRGWEKKNNFEFSHVPPKEAARRLKKLEQIRSQLDKATADLEKRSMVQQLKIRA